MNLTIRDLASFDDFKQAEAVEREVWEVSDRDVVPLALAIATKEAGNLWLGGFDGPNSPASPSLSLAWKKAA